MTMVSLIWVKAQIIDKYTHNKVLSNLGFRFIKFRNFSYLYNNFLMRS